MIKEEQEYIKKVIICLNDLKKEYEYKIKYLELKLADRAYIYDRTFLNNDLGKAKNKLNCINYSISDLEKKIQNDSKDKIEINQISLP